MGWLLYTYYKGRGNPKSKVFVIFGRYSMKKNSSYIIEKNYFL